MTDRNAFTSEELERARPMADRVARYMATRGAALLARARAIAPRQPEAPEEAPRSPYGLSAHDEAIARAGAAKIMQEWRSGTD